MSFLDAIAECRDAHEIEGARWPIPLLIYLDDPPNESRVVDWLCSCVGELLVHFGRMTNEFQDVLKMARLGASSVVGIETIEQHAQSLWLRRSTSAIEFTAVAQLLFSLLRLRTVRSDRPGFAASCAAPICLLERLESDRNEVLERVLSHFSDYVRNN